MIIQLNIVAKRYAGTDPIEGTLLISAQRHPVSHTYPHKVAWARRHFDLRTWPSSETELLRVAVLHLAEALKSRTDGIAVYDDLGERVANNLMG